MKKQIAIRQSDIYKEMQLTPEMLRSIRTLWWRPPGNYIHSKRFRVLLVPAQTGARIPAPSARFAEAMTISLCPKSPRFKFYSPCKKMGGAHLKRDWKFLRGDLYFIKFEQGTGSEQKGNRPAVVLQNDVGNLCSPTLVPLPL